MIRSRGARLATLCTAGSLGACIAALAFAGGGGAQTPTTTDTPIPVIGPAPFFPGLPFAEPPVVHSAHGHLRATLVAANVPTVRISGVDVEQTQTYGLAGANAPPRGLLGPTLHLEPGDVLDLVLDNRLVAPDIGPGSGVSTAAPTPHGHGAHAAQAGNPPQFTNLHFHGLHVTPRTRRRGNHFVLGDNVLATLHPGTTHIRFQIPWNHDQGTFWYHAHLHGMTDDQVYRGLAGLLVIGDVRRDLPARFRHVVTRSVALKDIQVVSRTEEQITPPRAVIPGPMDHDWVNPTHRTVNGLVNPRMTIRPGETQLWRLANVSSAVWYRVALLDAGNHLHPFTVVAQDGNTRAIAERPTRILLGPGQRFDVLVRAPASGTWTLVTLPFKQGRPGANFPQDVLATVDVTGEPAPAIAPLAHRIGDLPQFPTRRGRTHHFQFNIGNSGFTINGKVFDPQRADARPILGTTERWIITNASEEWHPFHIHQDDFRVISINGHRVRPLGDQDVVPLPPLRNGKPGRVVIDMPYTDYDGKFVFHCHILDHEDMGMMAMVALRKRKRR